MNAEGSPIDQILPAEAPSTRQLLNVVVCAAIVGALYLARQFLIPLTLAVLLAFVLAPLVQAFRRAGLPRPPAVLLAVALSLCAVCGIGVLVGSQLISLAQDAPRYQKVVQAKLGDISGMTTDRLDGFVERLRLKPPHHRIATLMGGPAPVARPVEIYQPPPTPLEIARRVLAVTLSPIATTGLVFVVAVFILLQQADLRDRVIRLIGSNDLHRTTVAMDDAATRLSRYFLSQFAVNAAFGGVFALGLYIIGVPHSGLWGALAGVLRFIPYAGGMISLSLAATMAAAAGPGWVMVAWTIGLFVALEAVVGQVVEPLLYGRSTGLSPVSIVVAAVFWTWLWGPIGLILSTPLSLCLLVLGRHVPRLEFIEVLLGDRPPLSPIETFYQRVLAGDADDALQQAEIFLKDGLLAAYYDHVAIRGLLLAARDAHRGILKREQLATLRGAVESLTMELGDQSPVVALSASDDLTSTSQAKLVVCIGGPGLLDDIGAVMLAQSLVQRGFAVEVASYRAASRENVSGLNLQSFDAVCVFHLQVGRSQTRFRALLRRIADQNGGAPIIVAMPSMEEPAADDILISDPRFADFATLQEVAEACGAFDMSAQTGRGASPTPRPSWSGQSKDW